MIHVNCFCFVIKQSIINVWLRHCIPPRRFPTDQAEMSQHTKHLLIQIVSRKTGLALALVDPNPPEVGGWGGGGRGEAGGGPSRGRPEGPSALASAEAPRRKGGEGNRGSGQSLAALHGGDPDGEAPESSRAGLLYELPGEAGPEHWAL